MFFWVLAANLGGALGSGSDVFGAEAEADEAGGDAAEEGPAVEETEGPSGSERFGTAEDAGDDVVLDDELKTLGGVRGKCSAPLDGFEIPCGESSVAKPRGEDVGGGDGILNREIDADTANGRHGVRSVADAEKSGTKPTGQTIHDHGQQADLLPVL